MKKQKFYHVCVRIYVQKTTLSKRAFLHLADREYWYTVYFKSMKDYKIWFNGFNTAWNSTALHCDNTVARITTSKPFIKYYEHRFYDKIQCPF